MLIGIDTSPCGLSTKQEYVQLENDIKIVRTLKLFVQKSSFHLFSLLSIPIFMGINGGYFTAIWRYVFRTTMPNLVYSENPSFVRPTFILAKMINPI